MRFFSSDGKELITRKDRQFTRNQILFRMKEALKKAGKTSEILALVEAETVKTSRVALSQHCFWTGELVIGGLSGVIKTEAGWLKGREVTLVDFDPEVISQKTLISSARAKSCADQAYADSELVGYRAARESDQKRQLQGTRFAKVKNHIATERLEQFLQTNELVPHGIVELYLNEKWVKCTPAFNKSLCDKLGVDVLEFDGENDSIFQEYDRKGAVFMEYLEDYGHYDDVPIGFIEKIMRQYYPHIFDEKGNVIPM